MRDAFAEAVETIYRAVEEPALWGEVLATLMATDSASTGALATVHPESTSVDFIADRGFSATARRLYAEYYHRVDPFAKLWLAPTPASVLGQDCVPPAEFERSEIWNDYSRVHLGAFHIIAASMPLFDGTIAALGLNRPREAAPFGRVERRRLDRFLPHLRGALRLRQRLAEAPGEARGLGFAVLDALEVGIVLVRADGTPVFANDAALASPALTIGAARRPVSAADPAAARALQAFVRDAATGGPGGAVVLEPQGRAAVAALVTPLPPGLGDEAGDRSLALVALRPLATPPAAIGDRLRGLFGLTRAEAALALALLAGQRPEEIAEARQVKLSTVRFQLRAALDKTGTRGQSDLVRLLGRLVPFRDDVEGRTAAGGGAGGQRAEN